VTPLAEQLARRIRTLGPVTVAEFMAEALGHPAHGYYTTRDPLGAGGDFVTAPEISQIFGELIGLWCADAWVKMGRPSPVILAELGPGRGTLMADALRAARVLPDFLAAIRLHLVEASPALREKQRTALAGHAPRWHATSAELPDGPLLLVANEFLDALPIRQFVRLREGWRERLVGLGADGGFAFLPAPGPTPSLALLPAALAGAPEGSLVEVCPAALALVENLARRLAAAPGAALFVDYGHARSGAGETLQAVRAHRRHEVLADPGAADLTAHVDFAALKEAAAAAGARVLGPVTQRDFLQELGIETRLATLLRRATPDQAPAVESGARRLIDAAEMGSLFKVMALAAPLLPPLAGFSSVQDLA
jgi:NADH dehydrogenase [ubiquinone] 1 alpha subcomplex assembly factor 7